MTGVSSVLAWPNNSDTRQPPGIGSDDELAVVVWDDTRNGDHVTDGQDLCAAAVQFDEFGWAGGQRTAAYGSLRWPGRGWWGWSC